MSVKPEKKIAPFAPLTASEIARLVTVHADDARKVADALACFLYAERHTLASTGKLATASRERVKAWIDSARLNGASAAINLACACAALPVEIVVPALYAVLTVTRGSKVGETHPSL